MDPAYDLVHASADYAPWNGVPRRTYLLCTHMRSGSTLLGEAMYRAGGMGCPLEYFHVGFQPRFEARWAATDFDAYLAALYRHRTDPSGSFGVKLFWRDLMELCAARFPDVAELFSVDVEHHPTQADAQYGFVRRLLDSLFPDPHFVLLTRRDRLRQAVSQIMARDSGVFREIPSVEELPARRIEPYDYETIRRSLAYVNYCQARWEAFIVFSGVTPCRVYYEDLASDYIGTVRSFLRAHGRKGDMPIAPPRMRPHRHRETQEYIQRFLNDVRDRRSLQGHPATSRDVSFETRVARHPRVVFGGCEDGIVLMNADSASYYHLDSIGEKIWNALTEPRTARELAEMMAAAYAVEHDRCQRDIAVLLGELLSEGILVEVLLPPAVEDDRHLSAD